jgi:RNA polymerase sigma-70 factor (ECF subfamily)
MCTSTIQAQPAAQQFWLAAARQGDHEAFSTLVRPHTPRLQRLARRLTRSAEDAEDVCQESLLKAFTKIDQFDGSKVEIEEFRAWLMRITTNCAIDFLRRKKADRYLPLEDDDNFSEDVQGTRRSWGENPEISYTRREQIRMVEDAISRLPSELRIVCLFRNVRELSTKETAARLGISAIAVRLRLFRAHGQLRKMLGGRMHRRNRGTPQGSNPSEAKKDASLN